MIRLFATAIALAALAAGTLSAQACNPLVGQNFGKHVAPMALPPEMLARNNPGAPVQNSIVGLWYVVHTQSDGTLFFDGYDTWHSDGLEEELGHLPPSTGAVCLGAWVQNGKKVQLLTHVDWLYDENENWTGTLNMTQANKLSSDGNSYKGSFDAKFYDTNGNLSQEITGTTTGQRLN